MTSKLVAMHGWNFLHRIKSTCIFMRVENVSMLIGKCAAIPVKPTWLYFTMCVVHVFSEVMFLCEFLGTYGAVKVNTRVNSHVVIQALFEFTRKAAPSGWA